MLILILISNMIHCSAADFSCVLSEQIQKHGLFDKDSGLFYASEIENDTMLVTIYAAPDSFIINTFGSDNEPADTLTIRFKNHTILSLSDTDDLYIYADKKYYRLINDKFTQCHKPDRTFKQLAEYHKGSIRLMSSPDKVIAYRNELNRRKISSLPSEKLSEPDLKTLTRLIKACADIQTYDYKNYDINTLTRRVLFTHRNFMLLTTESPGTTDISKHLHMCNEQFIRNAMLKAFRINAPRPAINMLNEIGYYANNGYYYYSGGYSKFFATDVSNIERSFHIDPDTLYIVFKDRYTSENSDPFDEYSTATAKKDADGWYLTSLNMNSDLSDLSELTDQRTLPVHENTNQTYLFIPVIILLLAAAGIGMTVYFLMLK